MKIYNEGYMPLSIESWKEKFSNSERMISVAHYFEQNGDLVPDPEIQITYKGLPIRLTQQFIVTDCAYMSNGKEYVIPRHKTSVCGFLSMWARNIKQQKFLDALRKDERNEKARNGTTGKND
jgi:hypothetical protein